MKISGDQLVLAATDLSTFLSCRHRTALDLAAAHGALAAPTWVDPFAALLRERGQEHEHRYVASLHAAGLRVVDLTAAPDPDAGTLDAMQAGADAIVQARLRSDRWLGYADILHRVAAPSKLGPWSYEVYDTKLARDTKAGTILQLAVYSDLLAGLQGHRPEYFHVVTPDRTAPVQRYRLADYEAYYRFVRRRLEAYVSRGYTPLLNDSYPEPVTHCEVCRWLRHCEGRRRRDDHVSYVAGLSRLHRGELQTRGITTLAQLSQMPVPLLFKPSRGRAATYERLQDQARLQVLSRESGQPTFSPLLPPDLLHGLCRLPEPSEGDLFLDLEGDPFARERGREYLFGIGWRSDGADFDYRSHWAFDDGAERAAFEALVDLLMDRWALEPGMHVYHFGHYEPSALKRLMGRYATREDAIDRLLRAERFVDLHQVVRHAIRAGVESYSIKQLEPFYGFARDVGLGDAGLQRRTLEIALETDALDALGDTVKAVVECYNRDDCRSTLALRDWLESVRATLVGSGHPIARPIVQSSAPPERVSALQDRVDEVRARLLQGTPVDPAARTPNEHSRWVLAYLLDWHRREDKAAWWEYYRLRDLADEELLDEPQAVADLTFVARIGEVRNKKTGRLTGTVIDRYTFPPQEMEIREDDELKLRDESKLGDVEHVDRELRVIDIRKSRGMAPQHPRSAFAHKHFPTDTMQHTLLRLGDAVVADQNDGCGLDLLFRRPPRLTTGPFAPRHEDPIVEYAVRCGLELEGSTLAIQGPPGSGKTFTGARMICQLVRAGKRVGVTAVSHKVIRNLLDAVGREAARLGQPMALGHKTTPHSGDPAQLQIVEDNGEALQLLANGSIDVLGGTAWLWARDEAAGALDVLFVDEAAQMSLANALAASQSARSMVLLGDPQQLEQPQKGSHPDGVDVSALEHVLAGAQTMSPDRGLFLPVTWRLAPSICGYTSEVFYESRLVPKPGLEHQAIRNATPFDGAGLWWVPVDHDCNQQWSAEEIEAVDRVVGMLLARGEWIDEHRTSKRLTGDDVLIVAPYNAQVSRLRERLAPAGVRVGTVDKFQGQEAPVVIYSMVSSSPEDAPRGMEFLYSLNRLNVATSRARCAVILIASPRLFEAECRTPRQMRLANALCRYRELARTI